LEHRAVGPRALALFVRVTQAQPKAAGRPQRQAGAQDRRVPRQADAVHGQPFVETGEARVEYAAVLMQRVPPARTAIEFHPHAVGPLPAALGAQTQPRLETPGVTRPSHEAIAQTALFGEAAQADALVTKIGKGHDPGSTDPEQMTAFQGTGDVAARGPAA